MITITDVKTEYRVNPIGVDNLNPVFSYKILCNHTILQTSYRLLVASSAEFLQKNQADLYDSGKIDSHETVGITYGGKPLTSRQKCYIKFFAYFGNEVIESDVNFFEMSLLHDEDWKGNWMSMPVNNQGGTGLYRKVIQAKEGFVRANAYVCGVGYNEFFVNGNKIGNSVLDPGVTDYSQRLLYSCYDILGHLKCGDNCIGIELGHGWYGSKQALVQVYIDYQDGTTEEYHSSTNGGWWVSGSPTIDNSIYGGEVYDARKEDTWPKNWASLDFEPTWENGWMFTVFAAKPQGKLEVQKIEPIEVCANYPSVSFKQVANKIWVADVGTNIAGWAEIKVQGARGSSVTLKYGERLKEDGFVNMLNLRSARASDTYILKGDGVETYAPRFTYHGFQYIQVEIEGDCTVQQIVGKHVHTNTRQAGVFECSDADFNQLHVNAVVTEYNNQHSILTDCPQRDERFGWLNDLGSRLYQTVYNCGMENFFPKFTRDITHTQLSSGAIGDTAPFYTGGRPADPVCIAYLLMPKMSYVYYGNLNAIESEYKNLKAWVDFLHSQSNGYIMNYSYYADWVAPTCFDEHTDNIFVSSAYLYWHLKEMADLAKLTKHKDDFAFYSKHAEESKKAFNEKYFNAETYNYHNGTQAENSIAVSLGIASKAVAPLVAANINQDVVNKNYHSSCGNIGYRHMFYVLADYGYMETALKILKNPEYPGWGFMLANGATSVWERWESEMSNEMDSFNHPMFGSYDALFYHYLGGIKIQDDAFACNKITISPLVAKNIDYVNCSFDTVRGKIVSNWKKTNGKVQYSIEVPPMVTAKIIIDGTEHEVQGGKHIF